MFLCSPMRFLLLPAYAEMPPVSLPVYSCKRSAKRQYFSGNLQKNK